MPLIWIAQSHHLGLHRIIMSKDNQIQIGIYQIDRSLFDGGGNEIKDKKEFAKLSLEFLDRYFADEYEIDSLVENAPKSQKELGK